MEALSIEIYRYFNVRLTEKEVLELIKNIPIEEDNSILLDIRNTLRAAILHPSKEAEENRVRELLKEEPKVTEIRTALNDALN